MPIAVDRSPFPKGSTAKSDNHQTSSRRNRKKKIKATYAKAREEAQLAGVIPTEPVGAVRDERVDPASQSAPPLPGLVATAIRNGWEVPLGRKPQLVDELISILDNPDQSAKVKVAAFNALRMADQHQFERDNPDQVKERGAFVLNISVVNTEQVEDVPIVPVTVTVVDADGSQQADPGVPEAVPLHGE